MIHLSGSRDTTEDGTTIISSVISIYYVTLKYLPSCVAPCSALSKAGFLTLWCLKPLRVY